MSWLFCNRNMSTYTCLFPDLRALMSLFAIQWNHILSRLTVPSVEIWSLNQFFTSIWSWSSLATIFLLSHSWSPDQGLPYLYWERRVEYIFCFLFFPGLCSAKILVSCKAWIVPHTALRFHWLPVTSLRNLSASLSLLYYSALLTSFCNRCLHDFLVCCIPLRPW